MKEVWVSEVFRVERAEGQVDKSKGRQGAALAI